MTATKFFAAAGLLALLCLGWNLPAALGQQQSVPKDKLLGSWDVEINAEGQSFYLIMVLSDNQGQFEGKISEQSGIITDAPLSALNYDGQSLTFEFNSPTPPDGVQRLIQTQFAWSNDILEGSVTIPDLGMTVPAKATKKPAN